MARSIQAWLATDGSIHECEEDAIAQEIRQELLDHVGKNPLASASGSNYISPHLLTKWLEVNQNFMAMRRYVKRLNELYMLDNDDD